MLNNRWSLFADLSELNRDLMNRLYSGVSMSRTTAWAPPVESFYQDNNLMVRVWVPGVDPATVDIKVSGNLLSIKRDRKFTYDVPENQYLLTDVVDGQALSKTAAKEPRGRGPAVPSVLVPRRSRCCGRLRHDEEQTQKSVKRKV